jgi:hypothetical protein
MKRRPASSPGGSSSWTAAFVPKWRRDHLLLLALVCAATFCAARMTHLRQSSRDASTIRTVLTTTQGTASHSLQRSAQCSRIPLQASYDAWQTLTPDWSWVDPVVCRRAVLRSGRGGEDDEPTSVVTELVIDSSGGQRRVKRKKQADSGGSSATNRGNGMQLRGSDALQLQRDSQGAANVQRQKTAAELYAEKQAAALARALPRDFDWQASLTPLAGVDCVTCWCDAAV